MIPVMRAWVFTLACVLVSVCAQIYPGPPPGALRGPPPGALRGPFHPPRAGLINRPPVPNPAGMQFMRKMAVSQAVLSSDYTKRMAAIDAIQNVPCVGRSPVLKYLLMDSLDMKPLPIPGSPLTQMNPATRLLILSDQGRRLEAGKLLQSRCVQTNERLGALVSDIADIPLAASALVGK
ncbi:uncharacterized protein 3-like [Haliotis rufescens]|uniref:uncharacterized protein 3-like n=1 Tax=Haliotis rufescens TaxID=6454 RepID=UPI001EB087B2|nr:uncharacterized protein 3-like [Haliotis rufescens]